MVGVLVPYRCALADATDAKQDTRFHHGSRLQVSHRYRRAFALLGKIGAARTGVVALSLPALRAALGTQFFKALHPIVGPASIGPVDDAGGVHRVADL